jgi:hypothetical protein
LIADEGRHQLRAAVVGYMGQIEPSLLTDHDAKEMRQTARGG